MHTCTRALRERDRTSAGSDVLCALPKTERSALVKNFSPCPFFVFTLIFVWTRKIFVKTSEISLNVFFFFRLSFRTVVGDPNSCPRFDLGLPLGL